MKKYYILLIILFITSCEDFNPISLQTRSIDYNHSNTICINNQIVQTPSLAIDIAQEGDTIKATAISNILPDNYYWYIDRELHSSNINYIALNRYNEINYFTIISDTNVVNNEIILLLYEITVIKTISLFVFLQYYLSAECLLNAYNKNTAIYFPFFSSTTFHTSQYIEFYENITNYSSYEFSTIKSIMDIDFFLAIKSFYVENTVFGSKITDIYDFDVRSTDNQIIQNLVRIFTYIEDSGIISSYPIEIYLDEPHTTICEEYFTGHKYSCNQCLLNRTLYNHPDISIEYKIDGHYNSCNECNYNYLIINPI